MPRIAPDKQKHFFVGILMGAVLMGISWWLFPGRYLLTILIAFAAAAAISYGWELFSKITGKGHYDIWDAVASIIGGVTGMGIILLVILL